MITSLLLPVRVSELVLVVQEKYEQVPVLPRHPWVARVAIDIIAATKQLTSQFPQQTRWSIRTLSG